MMRSLYNDHERFEKTYFSEYSGYYLASDKYSKDKNGYYFIDN